MYSVWSSIQKQKASKDGSSTPSQILWVAIGPMQSYMIQRIRSDVVDKRLQDESNVTITSLRNMRVVC